MKYEEFQEYLREPLDPKWKPRFLALYEYAAVLPRVNVGFILSVPDEDEPAEVEKAVTEWNEMFALISPLYMVTGDRDTKAWVEKTFNRKITFMNGWFQSDVFLCVANVPLKLTNKGSK